MNLFAVLLQFLLATVLAIAAIGKFLDLPGSRRAVKEFGVPARYAGIGGTALPVVELALAVGLLVPETARWAALLAGLLFLSFIAAIGWNLSEGRQPDCHCFGQLHSEPAGWATLARNTLLTLAAALVVWQGGDNPVGWISALSTAGRIGLALGIAVLAVAGVLGWLLSQLTQQNERILGRLERFGQPDAPATVVPEAEAPAVLTEARVAPEFDLPDQDGGRLTLKGLLKEDRPTLLIFSDPGCGPCNSLMPDVGEWQRRYAGEVGVALISRRSLEDNLVKSAEHGITHVGLQDGREIDELYGANGTPTGILVQPDGTIRHEAALGPGPIRSLFSRALTNRQRAKLGQPELPQEEPAAWDDENPLDHLPTALEVGAPAPTLPLRDLDGHFSGLEDFRGNETVVVFMSPSCAFSQRMLPDLHEWAGEEAAAGVRERLVIVSDGDPDENRKMDLPGRVFLDEGFTLGRAFGASGTPAAVLLDAEGRLASPLALGEDAVLDLLYDQSEANEAVPV